MSLISDIFNVFNSGREAGSISNANIAAEHGVLGAASDASSDITKTLAGNRKDINSTLNNIVAPYTTAGDKGVKALQDYALSKPQFKFDLKDYFNSPAYQFQLKEGENAIINQNAAGGGFGGQTLKDLTQYGQGLASTYYNQAFNNQLAQFNTNQNTTLRNLAALTGAGEFGTQETLNAKEGLAQEGLQGNEVMGSLGLNAAQVAGNYAVNAGNAHAAGIAGQGQALAGTIGDIAGLAAGAFTGGAGVGGTAGGLLSGIFGPH